MKRAVAGFGRASSLSKAPRTIGEVVCLRIRDDLLNGRFEPGCRLQSDELKERYGCGISPLREALNRLTSERLVVNVGQKGFQVPAISLVEMWEITRLRQMLETEALRGAIAAGDNDWESQIVASFHHLSKVNTPDAPDSAADDWERIHRNFHMALVAACPSRWTLHLVELLYNHSERYRMIRLARTARSQLKRNVNHEHKRIMEAVLSRDQARACELQSQHIERTAQFITACLTPAEPAADGPQPPAGRNSRRRERTNAAR